MIQFIGKIAWILYVLEHRYENKAQGYLLARGLQKGISIRQKGKFGMSQLSLNFFYTTLLGVFFSSSNPIYF
jgi:hypothetical protein